MPRRKPRERREPPIPLVAASVSAPQVVNRWATRARPDYELMARAVGTMYAAANLNATVCTGQRMRLYRPARGGGLASRMWPGRSVRDRARLAWIVGDAPVRPGVKALAYASAADDIEEVVEHPVLDLLGSPDPRITCAQWLWLLFFWMEMTGRAFVWAGETFQGAPTALYPLAPHYTLVVGSKTSFISHYRYGRDSTDGVDLPAEDVIYLRERVHPSDPLGAVSWTHSVIMPSDMEAAALASEVKRWENGGFPGGAVELDPKTITTREQWRQYLTDFNAMYSGVRNAGKWMILLNGRIVPGAVKPNELAYKDGLLECERRIWTAAGVPETVWRMSESNRASAVVGDPAYMGYTILPKCNSFADTLTERLLPRFSGTEGWWFAFDNPVREDRSREVQECISLVGAGVMTANEARAKLGLPLGDETLDVPRVNGVALATPTVVSASSFTCCEGHGEKVRKDLSTVERQFADELRAWYERAVRGAVSESGAVEVVSDAELERIIVDGMRRVFREAARSAEEDVDGSVIDAAAARYARERSAELIRGITETLRTQVREVIANGIMAGESLNEIRARLMESGLSEIRSETVLRTELARVEQASRRLVYAEAGYDGKTWVLAGEPCPLCEGIDRLLKGTVVPIGEPFLRVGTTVMGTDGKAYFIDRDIVDAPQAHPNCRCTANFVRGGGAA